MKEDVINLLKDIFNRFCIVGMCILTVAFCAMKLDGVETIPLEYVRTLLLISAFCGVGDIFFFRECELEKRQLMKRQICHYIYINIVVILGGYLYTGGLEFGDTLSLLICIGIIYWINKWVYHTKDSKLADEINERLKDISKE